MYVIIITFFKSYTFVNIKVKDTSCWYLYGNDSSEK